jgi:hypothetical protein
MEKVLCLRGCRSALDAVQEFRPPGRARGIRGLAGAKRMAAFRGKSRARTGVGISPAIPRSKVDFPGEPAEELLALCVESTLQALQFGPLLVSSHDIVKKREIAPQP